MNKEQARLYAEQQVQLNYGENWDRKDHIMLGIFYGYYTQYFEKQNAELLQALEECEEYFDNKADYRGMDEEGRPEPDNEMKLLTIVRNAIQKAEK